MTDIRAECCEEIGLVVEQGVQLRSASDAEIEATMGSSSQVFRLLCTGQQLPHQASSALGLGAKRGAWFCRPQPN